MDRLWKSGEIVKSNNRMWDGFKNVLRIVKFTQSSFLIPDKHVPHVVGKCFNVRDAMHLHPITGGRSAPHSTCYQTLFRRKYLPQQHTGAIKLLQQGFHLVCSVDVINNLGVTNLPCSCIWAMFRHTYRRNIECIGEWYRMRLNAPARL